MQKVVGNAVDNEVNGNDRNPKTGSSTNGTALPYLHRVSRGANFEKRNEYKGEEGEEMGGYYGRTRLFHRLFSSADRTHSVPTPSKSSTRSHDQIFVVFLK